MLGAQGGAETADDAASRQIQLARLDPDGLGADVRRVHRPARFDPPRQPGAEVHIHIARQVQTARNIQQTFSAVLAALRRMAARHAFPRDAHRVPRPCGPQRRAGREAHQGVGDGTVGRGVQVVDELGRGLHPGMKDEAAQARPHRLIGRLRTVTHGQPPIAR